MMSLVGKLFGRTTMEKVTWLETDELLKLLAGPSPPLLIDVRGPDEFFGPMGHIDTAENVPLDQLPTNTGRLLGKRRQLVLVCHTDRRSTAAAQQLRGAGGSDIAVLRGGMVAWRSHRLP